MDIRDFKGIYGVMGPIYDYETDKTGLFNSTKKAYHWTNTTYITMLHVYLICLANLISLFAYDIQIMYCISLI